MSDCRKCVDEEWCAEHEDCGLFKPKPLTNADRLRAMSDEELANYNWQLQNTRERRSTNGWLEWMKQEAKDG